MIFNVMLYGLHLPVRNLARLNKDGQGTFYRASLHPAKDNPNKVSVSLSLAPVGTACILDGITVAGREGRIVIRKCLTATLTGTPIFGRHQPFCVGVAGPVHKATLDAAAAEFG